MSQRADVLIDWFVPRMRPLPWRVNRSPYRVLVSEFMLQQTRVDQATPYFLRFMECFPDVQSLASASVDDVLKMWEGLGYYRRVHHLHAAAQAVCESMNGVIPDRYDVLLTLPGIGPYTAAAVASLAFGEAVPVVDGNVVRVITRLFALDGLTHLSRTRAMVRDLASEMMDSSRPGLFNEAMMELGATCCLPRSPDCIQCPFAAGCQAFQTGDPMAYPVQKKKKAVPHYEVGAGVVINEAGYVLIAQRRSRDMLGGLWEFPGGKALGGESIPDCIRRELMEELRIDTISLRHLITVRHAYSHFKITLHAWLTRWTGGDIACVECADFAWVTPDRLSVYAMSRADVFIRDYIQEHQEELKNPFATGGSCDMKNSPCNE